MRSSWGRPDSGQPPWNWWVRHSRDQDPVPCQCVCRDFRCRPGRELPRERVPDRNAEFAEKAFEPGRRECRPKASLARADIPVGVDDAPGHANQVAGTEEKALAVQGEFESTALDEGRFVLPCVRVRSDAGRIGRVDARLEKAVRAARVLRAGKHGDDVAVNPVSFATRRHHRQKVTSLEEGASRRRRLNPMNHAGSYRTPIALNIPGGINSRLTESWRPQAPTAARRRSRRGTDLPDEQPPRTALG